MKNIFVKICILAALLALISPIAAFAQQIDSVYITPRLIYSFQMGEMSPSKWRNGSWSSPAIDGEEKDKNMAFGLAVGTDLGYSSEWPVRVEAEYVYRGKAEFSKGPKAIPSGGGAVSQKFEVKSHSLMVNAFYDINTATAFTPYIGLGLGGAFLKTDYKASISSSGPISGSQNNWNLAWNIGGGAAYHINENAALDFGYRYVDLGTVSGGSQNTSVTTNAGIINFSGSREMDYTAHEFSVGLRLTGF